MSILNGENFYRICNALIGFWSLEALKSLEVARSDQAITYEALGDCACLGRGPV